MPQLAKEFGEVAWVPRPSATQYVAAGPACRPAQACRDLTKPDRPDFNPVNSREEFSSLELRNLRPDCHCEVKLVVIAARQAGP